ncbi:MAG: P-II family nitrogen regulator [Planctomycetales bacterium]|nr:P-II family nitrogen regulator [Planctomycetales bacterium]
MKLIMAVIQPTRLQAVIDALSRLEVTRLTVCDAQGYGRQLGQVEMYRGREYTVHLLRKVVLEIAVNDDFLDRTIDCILETSRTGSEGNIGDGKVFILPLDDVVRIGNTTRGMEAV